MSSDLQSTLDLLRFNNYTTIVIISAVAYDYIIIFPREIDHVWRKHWTWVSTIFVIVRYAGLGAIILNALTGGSSLLPGPLEACKHINSWYNIQTKQRYRYRGCCGGFRTIPAYLAITEVVMILRVYAIWNRSRGILYFLLFLFAVQICVSAIIYGMYVNPSTYVSVTVIHAQDISFCASSWNIPQDLYAYSVIASRLILVVSLFALALTQALKESVKVYRAKSRWQLNRYIKLFTTHGLLYFAATLFYNVIYVIPNGIVTNSPKFMLVLKVVACLVTYPMMPRFIISVREMYDRESRGYWRGVDSGFGVFSQQIASEHAATSTIAFAEGVLGQDDEIKNEDQEDSEGIELVVRDRTRQLRGRPFLGEKG